MTNTVYQSFRILLRKIELSLPDYMEINRRQSEIESYLGRYISRFSTAIIGPYSRKTLISPLHGNSIELMVLFNQEKQHDYFPSDLAEKLAVTLRAEFEGTVYDEKRYSLTVPFEHFSFIVRPGFLKDDNCYLVPSDTYRYWVDYNAVEYKESFLKVDGSYAGMLRRLVQLLKAWNRENGKLFDDYYLELLMMEVIPGADTTSHAAALRHVFERACGEVMFKKQDPANRAFMVEGLLDLDQIIEATEQFRRAFIIADLACEKEQQDDIESALELWHRLFPQSFPSGIDMRVDTLRDSGAKGHEALRRLITQ